MNIEGERESCKGRGEVILEEEKQRFSHSQFCNDVWSANCDGVLPPR